MEATSITPTTNTIIEPIAQPLLEEIKEVEFQIQDSLVHGAIHAATEIIRKLPIWVEDLIWKSYLTSLLQCEIIMSWLRALGAQKGFRLVSYQQIWVTLPTGTKIQEELGQTLNCEMIAHQHISMHLDVEPLNQRLQQI